MTFKQAFWAYWIFFTVIAGMLVLFLVFLCSNSYLLCVMLATRRCPEKQVRYYFAIISILTLVFGACLYIFSALLLNLYQFFDSNRKAAPRPCTAIPIGGVSSIGLNGPTSEPSSSVND